MRKVVTYLTVLFMSLTSSLLFPKTHYIAPDGNYKNSGTRESPFASIQIAHDVAEPGDTLCLRGGNYYPDNQTIFSQKGNASAYFVLVSYSGEIPVIDGINIPDGNINQSSTVTWNFSGAEYWKIIGPIILTNGRGTGLLVDMGQFLEFDRIESCYNGYRAARAGHGFMIWQGSDITFNNCDAHHNANHLWKNGEDKEGNQFQHGDGWRIFSGANIRLEGCRSWHNLDDNYDLYGADNPIELNNCWSAYGGRDDSLGTVTGVPGKDMPRIDGSNLLWGNGIKLGYDQDNVKHKVIRCITWGNNAAGFHMNLGPSAILNSVSYNNKVFGFDYTDGNKHEMHNNIEFDNNYDNPGYPETIADLSISGYNSWDSTINISVSDDDFISLDDTGMLSPRKSDGSLPETEFLHLAEGSDLINAGIDVGLPFSGNAPDLGAFELENGTTYLVSNSPSVLPNKLDLVNYPNPFNPITTVKYTIPYSGNVEIAVYDITGRKVSDLFQGNKRVGTYTYIWNARNNNGDELTSGVYLLSIKAKNYFKTIKMMYLR